MPQKSRICFVSIDVEYDPRKEKSGFKGVESLGAILSLFEKYGIQATLFVTGEVLEKYEDLIAEWRERHEIACHSYTHKFWNTLTLGEREKELKDFVSLYRSVFKKSPIGFRAPSHVIDRDGLRLVEKKGFLYDSSIVPHYPPFKKYRGYKGRAPLLPHCPEGMNILEIPNAGQLLGIPLAGTWLRKLPLAFYKIIFLFHKPRFVSLSMHSWDALYPEFGERLEEILGILRRNYQFLNGEQILKNRR